MWYCSTRIINPLSETSFQGLRIIPKPLLQTMQIENKNKLKHLDQLRITKDRSNDTHKVKAVVDSIREKYFAGCIHYTIDKNDHIHVLTNKSHDNAVKGIKQAAKARFGIETEIVEKDGYKTVIALTNN